MANYTPVLQKSVRQQETKVWYDICVCPLDGSTVVRFSRERLRINNFKQTIERRSLFTCKWSLHDIGNDKIVNRETNIYLICIIEYTYTREIAQLLAYLDPIYRKYIKVNDRILSR